MYGLIPEFLRGGAAQPTSGRRTPPAQNPRGLKGAWRGRPHTDEMVFAVRQLVEGTALAYGEIAARTGVGRASICRWKQDGSWTRPKGAPAATDTVGSFRASAKLRARTLHRRAQAIAECILDDLERDPSGREELWTALEMLRAARLARMPKKRRPKGTPKPEPERRRKEPDVPDYARWLKAQAAQADRHGPTSMLRARIVR